MPLFPNMNTNFYNENNMDILNRMERFYQDSVTMNQQFWSEADIDTRFYAGDQTVLNEMYGNLPISQRRQFTFNRIRKIIEMPGGFQRKNRKSTVVIPVENSDQVTADQFTKLLMWANRKDGVSNTISEAFTGSLITGMNLLQVWMDYREDPVNGNIKVSNCSYNTFVIDPYFKKTDLSDCDGIWKRSYVNKAQAYSLLPNRAEDIDMVYNSGSRDGKFPYMPEAYNYNQSNLLAYDEYFYRDYRKQTMLIDTESGETMEWRGKDEDLKEYLARYPQITSMENDIPTVRLAILLQGRVMYDGPNPMGIDEYPFVPVFAYYTPELPYFQWRVQGIVRGLRDAQYLYNRRKIIELDIMESQVNSGWIAKENAFVDPKTAYKTGQGQVMWLKQDAQMTDIQQIPTPQISPSMFQLSEQLGREIMDISGINEELLGSASDDKAGVLSMLRQGAGLTTLQRLFDQLDLSQKMLGDIMIKLIQNNFTPGKVKRIIEEDPSDQFYNKNFGTYDAAIEEGFDTTTQKELQFAQLLNLRAAGVDIPQELIIEASTLQNKNKLIEYIQQKAQQAQQMQQAQMQSAQQQEQATMQMAQARAEADMGLAQERMSRIQENQELAVERRAEAIQKVASAHKEEEAALINKIKMLKELQDIDIRQLEGMLRIYNSMKMDTETDYEKQLNRQEQMKQQLKQDMSKQFPQQQREQSPLAEQPPVNGQ